MGYRAFTTALLLIASFPILAGASEMTDRLDKMLLEQEELLPGWKVVPPPEQDKYYRALKESFDASMKRKGDGFVYKAQGVRVEDYTYQFYAFAFKNSALRQWMAQTLAESKRRYGWNWHTFDLGGMIFLVLPAIPEVANGIEDILSWKFVEPRVRKIEERFDQSEPGKTGEAEFHLHELINEMPECTRLRIAAALVYMDRVKPPNVDKAFAQLQACLDLQKYVTIPPERLRLVYRTLARIHMSKGRKKEAVECLEKAFDSAGEGLRGKARMLANLAALQVEHGDIEGCLESLEEAVRLEAPLGYNDVLLSVKSDPAFSAIHEHRRFLSLVKKYGTMDKPIVFMDLECPKVALEKTRLLVLPPFAVCKDVRDGGFEKNIESALKRKLGKESVFFGKKREILRDQGKDDCGRFFCHHATQAIIGQACFDMKKYAGGQHEVPEYASRLREIVRSFGIARSAPTYLFAIHANLVHDGKEGKTTVMMSSVLYNTSTHRVLIFLRIRKTFKEATWKKSAPNVILELHRDMKKRLRRVR